MAEKTAYTMMASAEVRLKVAMKGLDENITQENGTTPTEQNLSRTLATLKTHWSSYENAYNAYIELMNLEDAVPLLESHGRVSRQYDEVVEKSNALMAVRVPPAPEQAAPRQPTSQEQYDLASQMRENTFGEAGDIVKAVIDYCKDKREETATSLKHQKDELSKAEELLKEASLYTNTMAGLMPDHSARDYAADQTKAREVKRLVREQMNVLSLLSPATPPAATVSSRDSSYMYERRKLPSFGGARRDYPSFRREWQGNVTGKFSAEYELREIKQNTPSEVEPDLKNLKSMKDVWEFLDRKYGRTMELASELISGLHNFKFSSKARTESAKFAELDREWTKVYYDLEEVGKLDALDHEPTLNGLAHKLPSIEAKKAYGNLRIKMVGECEKSTPPTEVSELEVMKQFMKAERQRQEVYAGLLDEEVVVDTRRQGGRSSSSSPCIRCGRTGHTDAECPGRGSARSHANQQVPAPCPACSQQHTYQTAEGNTRYQRRLSGCSTFRNLGVSDRAALVEKVKGCALCLDFTGNHQRDHCPARGRDGQPFLNCNEMVNGAPCNKQHSWLLHGTTSKYSNYVHINRSHISIAPTDEEITASLNSTTLMQLQMIPVGRKKGVVNQCLTFFDIGSNIHLVRKEFALKLGLKGQQKMLDLSTTGQRKELRESTVYWVPLVDRQGVEHNVMAYAMDNITAPMEADDVTGAEELFPMVSKALLKRPSGPVDLLVGIHMAGIFPYLANREEHLKGNLRLMTSIFGTGFLLDGDHAEISANVMMESPEARDLIRSYSASQARASIKEDQVKMSHQVSRQAEVITAEEVLSSREEALRENPFASLFPSLKEAAARITSEKNWYKEVEEDQVSASKAEAETEENMEKHTVKDDAVLSSMEIEEEKNYKVANSCEEVKEQVSKMSGDEMQVLELSLLEVGRPLAPDQVTDLAAIEAPRAGVGG